MTKVVLVHGAWHDARSWDALRIAWPIDQFDVDAITLPSASGDGSLEGDARALSAFCTDDEVVLVAHSYGGAVATEAAGSIKALRGVVYLAAFRPLIGESVTACARRAPARSELDAAISLDGERLVLAPAAAHALYGDIDAELVRSTSATWHAQPLATFREPLSSDVPLTVPTHYVVCRRDGAVPVTLQEEMASRCHAQSELDTSHCPQIEDPALTARHLVAIIEGL
jgi:pimeloyl-ACP methyl ester carboxylesterase